MHELAITEELMSIVVREAEKAEARRVIRVHLLLGELSSIVEDSVRFYWEFLSRDTVCAGAELEFQKVEASVKCCGCGQAYQPQERDSRCPECGEAFFQVLSGNEFRVEFIEVE